MSAISWLRESIVLWYIQTIDRTTELPKDWNIRYLLGSRRDDAWKSEADEKTWVDSRNRWTYF